MGHQDYEASRHRSRDERGLFTAHSALWDMGSSLVGNSIAGRNYSGEGVMGGEVATLVSPGSQWGCGHDLGNARLWEGGEGQVIFL
eukprot:CAMPEP_0172574042 /NCGR_PEP_ID=MMETSP1067-20121228/136503_1 /TAXON_ID=265564 ORGANISM="Thalassiosira punctigera, Strain Tpunct2005C2" /NCGR_SAMPLE_ID=MMETSP1067 /ASSEMBLY_ACC=CAM_ASM_000444 /LENGTH=85 /DNA_ID=CAMNT_0013366665 /DNA_START=704 /DNA_END=961 /DNA_ORIENTATION=-